MGDESRRFVWIMISITYSSTKFQVTQKIFPTIGRRHKNIRFVFSFEFSTHLLLMEHDYVHTFACVHFQYFCQTLIYDDSQFIGNLILLIHLQWNKLHSSIQ